ncbi:unnamed protein product [Symbiodinium microadriaticum]|nr:unnamed protein product [Symbiodinium sp. KB8]CAE7222474.1 unnamed protein product [Symbiodinium microadriaticum]
MSKKDMLVLAKTLGVGCQGSKAVLTKRLRKVLKELQRPHALTQSRKFNKGGEEHNHELFKKYAGGMKQVVLVASLDLTETLEELRRQDLQYQSLKRNSMSYWYH